MRRQTAFTIVCDEPPYISPWDFDFMSKNFISCVADYKKVKTYCESLNETSQKYRGFQPYKVVRVRIN
jgi:hypothetical protein